jgi:hypothetical protein
MFSQYRVMRETGLTRFGAGCFVLLMILLWPFYKIAEWATPTEKGFGKFKERE